MVSQSFGGSAPCLGAFPSAADPGARGQEHRQSWRKAWRWLFRFVAEAVLVLKAFLRALLAPDLVGPPSVETCRHAWAALPLATGFLHSGQLL